MSRLCAATYSHEQGEAVTSSGRVGAEITRDQARRGEVSLRSVDRDTLKGADGAREAEIVRDDRARDRDCGTTRVDGRMAALSRDMRQRDSRLGEARRGSHRDSLEGRPSSGRPSLREITGEIRSAEQDLRPR